MRMAGKQSSRRTKVERVEVGVGHGQKGRCVMGAKAGKMRRPAVPRRHCKTGT